MACNEEWRFVPERMLAGRRIKFNVSRRVRHRYWPGSLRPENQFDVATSFAPLSKIGRVKESEEFKLRRTPTSCLQAL
jgi:hypothetical protein